MKIFIKNINYRLHRYHVPLFFQFLGLFYEGIMTADFFFNFFLRIFLIKFIMKAQAIKPFFNILNFYR